MFNWLAKLLRRTTQSDPRQPVGSRWSDAGQYVSDDKALTCAAYWGCIRVISGALSQLPWRIMQATPTGAEAAESHPAYSLIYEAPNEYMEAGTWRELMVKWVLSWGNAFNEIQRDASNRPINLHPIEPWRVSPEWIGGSLYYKIRNEGAEEVYLPSADVLHFRGMGEGIMGFSVITLHPNSIARQTN